MAINLSSIWVGFGTYSGGHLGWFGYSTTEAYLYNLGDPLNAKRWVELERTGPRFSLLGGYEGNLIPLAPSIVIANGFTQPWEFEGSSWEHDWTLSIGGSWGNMLKQAYKMKRLVDFLAKLGEYIEKYRYVDTFSHGVHIFPFGPSLAAYQGWQKVTMTIHQQGVDDIKEWLNQLSVAPEQPF